VEARGEKGNLFFTDARRLKAGFLYNPAALPTLRRRLLERAHTCLSRAHA